MIENTSFLGEVESTRHGEGAEGTPSGSGGLARGYCPALLETTHVVERIADLARDLTLCY